MNTRQCGDAPQLRRQTVMKWCKQPYTDVQPIALWDASLPIAALSPVLAAARGCVVLDSRSRLRCHRRLPLATPSTILAAAKSVSPLPSPQNWPELMAHLGIPRHEAPAFSHCQERSCPHLLFPPNQRLPCHIPRHGVPASYSPFLSPDLAAAASVPSPRCLLLLLLT